MFGQVESCKEFVRRIVRCLVKLRASRCCSENCKLFD